MAQKTTNKDLSQIINQLKLVKRFFETSQVVEYKKCERVRIFSGVPLAWQRQCRC